MKQIKINTTLRLKIARGKALKQITYTLLKKIKKKIKKIN